MYFYFCFMDILMPIRWTFIYKAKIKLKTWTCQISSGEHHLRSISEALMIKFNVWNFSLNVLRIIIIYYYTASEYPPDADATLTLAFVSAHLSRVTANTRTCVGDLPVPGSVQLPDPALSFVQIPAENRFNDFRGSRRRSGRCGRHDCCRYSVSGATYSMVLLCWQTP